MKFKHLFLNIFIISILLSGLLKTKVGLGKSQQITTDRVKSLEKEKFAYAHNITHQLIGSRIITQFAPQDNRGKKLNLNKLALSLGYDHFNWASYVEKDPYGVTNRAGQLLNTPYNDPPQGGYRYDPADKLPFYWDLVKCDRCKLRHHIQHPINTSQFKLLFEDAPIDYRLQRGEAVEFVTSLVGVKQYDLNQQTAEWEILSTFRWKLTNPHSNFGQVSLTETDVDLKQLSPMLLNTMQLDGANISSLLLD